MRGRTLNDAFIILDEAQNATKAQMKMFLTRMGQQCRMIVTGDVTQIDLIRRQDSGLVQAADLLKDIDGISVIRLTESVIPWWRKSSRLTPLLNKKQPACKILTECER